MELKAWIRTAGKAEPTPVPARCLRREVRDGAMLVSVDIQSEAALDSEEGAIIEMALDAEPAAFMADYRHSEYWCRPAFGHNLTDVPDETQGLILRLEDGRFTVVLPVTSEQYKCVLRGAGPSRLTARLFSWYDGLHTCKALAFACKTGDNPYQLLQDCTRAALAVLHHGCGPREERAYPELLEYLGWCSWDAMQIRVSEEGLLAKCRELRDKGIPVRWAIIDDMWAEVHTFYGATYQSFQEMVTLMHASPLYAFEGDPQRFPHGLSGCIDRMKEYGLQVGVWYPTTGYWFGIEPGGPLFEQVKHCLIQCVDGRYVPSPEPGKAFEYFRTLDSFLQRCGADFIKLDNQSMCRRFYKGVMPVGEASRSLHTAMEAACAFSFGNRMINCMGMASEDMWNRPISAVSRCSDDFLPDNSAWFTKHILQCAYNSLIQGQFLWCDWDMWWTNDPQALKNSVLRAISGGPIYVSDKLGESQADMLRPLTLSDGRILRTDRPAVPTADCLTEDPERSGKPFKLQSLCGQSGVVAVFNLSRENTRVEGRLSPADVDGLVEDTYVVYEHFSRDVRILRRTEAMDILLPSQKDFRLYLIIPYRDGYAPIGLCDKFIAPKTIESIDGEQVRLRESGLFAWVKDGWLYTAHHD